MFSFFVFGLSLFLHIFQNCFIFKQYYQLSSSAIESSQTVTYETYKDTFCVRAHWKFQKLWAAYISTMFFMKTG